MHVVGHAMGVGVVGHRHRGHAVGMGLCHGVCAVGHQRRGHAVGVVGHRFWVLPWVWVAVGFICVVMGGLYFCGCGLIFLGSCELILVVVVVDCVKWWLADGCDCFKKKNVVMIVVY